jgi:hypothetical protein
MFRPGIVELELHAAEGYQQDVHISPTCYHQLINTFRPGGIGGEAMSVHILRNLL